MQADLGNTHTHTGTHIHTLSHTYTLTHAHSLRHTPTVSLVSIHTHTMEPLLLSCKNLRLNTSKLTSIPVPEVSLEPIHFPQLYPLLPRTPFHQCFQIHWHISTSRLSHTPAPFCTTPPDSGSNPTVPHSAHSLGTPFPGAFALEWAALSVKWTKFLYVNYELG